MNCRKLCFTVRKTVTNYDFILSGGNAEINRCKINYSSLVNMKKMLVIVRKKKKLLNCRHFVLFRWLNKIVLNLRLCTHVLLVNVTMIRWSTDSMRAFCLLYNRSIHRMEMKTLHSQFKYNPNQKIWFNFNQSIDLKEKNWKYLFLKSSLVTILNQFSTRKS